MQIIPEQKQKNRAFSILYTDIYFIIFEDIIHIQHESSKEIEKIFFGGKNSNNICNIWLGEMSEDSV